MAGSIGGISSAGTAAYPVQGGKRPDPSEAFSKLDADNKGYIDAADLEQAAQAQDGKGPSADDVMKTLDTSGDGKITKEEFTDGAKKLGEQLHAQFDQSRVDSAVAASGAAAAGAEGDGATVASSGGAAATGTSGGSASLVGSSAGTTYEAADTNEDGSVSEKERLAYEQKTQAAQQAYQQAAASFESQSSGSLQTAA